MGIMVFGFHPLRSKCSIKTKKYGWLKGVNVGDTARGRWVLWSNDLGKENSAVSHSIVSVDGIVVAPSEALLQTLYGIHVRWERMDGALFYPGVSDFRFRVLFNFHANICACGIRNWRNWAFFSCCRRRERKGLTELCGFLTISSSLFTICEFVGFHPL